MNARRMSIQPETLRLVGYAGCDFGTGHPTLRPSEIIYFVYDDGRRHWLVRQEKHLDSLTNQNSRLEFVCADVRAIEVQPHGPTRDGGDFRGGIPPQVHVTLVGSKKQAVIDEVFFLRAVGTSSSAEASEP